jgi:hypothetical protein
MKDSKGNELAIGDRVLPIRWGTSEGIPLYLSNIPGTVVGLGRTRVQVKFDGVSYTWPEPSPPHSIAARSTRKIETKPAAAGVSR